MIYLLYGEDAFLRDEYLKKIKKQFGEIQQGINYVQIGETDIASLISELETPPFGYDKKMIVVKESNLFKRKNIDSEKLVEYLEKTNLDGIELIFLEKEIEKGKLFNLIQKIGTVVNFEEQKVPQLINKVISIASAYKVNIDNSTAQYFIECCGTNMNYIINEIRKLIEYAGEGGTIKKEDVDALTIKNVQSIIFELTDNLGKRNPQKTIEILNNLINSKEPVQRILIMMYSHIKKLFMVKLCKGKNVSEILNLKPNQLFLISKYKTQASYFEQSELEEIMMELIKLDENFKVGNIDLQVGLEAILCRYI